MPKRNSTHGSKTMVIAGIVGIVVVAGILLSFSGGSLFSPIGGDRAAADAVSQPTHGQGASDSVEQNGSAASTNATG